MTDSTVDRIIATAELVREYEHRIAALSLALQEDGKDTQSAIFISERIAEREASLVGFRNGLDAVIEEYRDEREAARLDAARNTVETIHLPVPATRRESRA